jgi:hypothetical protein
MNSKSVVKELVQAVMDAESPKSRQAADLADRELAQTHGWKQLRGPKGHWARPLKKGEKPNMPDFSTKHKVAATAGDAVDHDRLV